MKGLITSRLKIVSCGFCSLLIVVACATPSDDHDDSDVAASLTDMDLVEDRTVDSIRDYRIDGWRYVDRYNVILTAAHDENYLVSFMSPCLGLDGSFSIGFTSSAGGVTRFDDIVVRGPGGQAEVCRIEEIVRLKDSDKGSD